MTFPGGDLFPGYDTFPSSSSTVLPTVGTVWEVDGWTGYEGMPPIPDDLGCVHWVTSTDDSPAVDGWDGAPAPRVDSVDRPTADGTNDGIPTQPGKTVTIKGRVRAPDVPTLQQAMGRLSGVLIQRGRYGTLVAREAWMTRQMRVRRGADTLIAPVRSSGYFEAVYSFVLYGPGGVRLGAPLTDWTGLPSTSGGITVPLTVPVVMAETVVSGIVSLTNTGATEGPVVIRLDGPMTGPVITHVGSGQQLVFAANLTIGADEFLIVDMDRHEVLANGQSSRNQGVLPDGRGWSRFDVGENLWTIAARAGGPAARMTVMATPAWP